MLHACFVMIIPFGAWAWSYYRHETYSADDQLQSVLRWVFYLGIAAFILTIIIKALVSKPKCPDCDLKMKELETIEIEHKLPFKFKEKTRWRIVHCDKCGSRYRIPGLS